MIRVLRLDRTFLITTKNVLYVSYARPGDMILRGASQDDGPLVIEISAPRLRAHKIESVLAGCGLCGVSPDASPNKARTHL